MILGRLMGCESAEVITAIAHRTTIGFAGSAAVVLGMGRLSGLQSFDADGFIPSRHRWGW